MAPLFIACSDPVTSVSCMMSHPTSPESAQGPASSKMLVLCFDGTANEYDDENTNVVKFFAMLRKDCDHEQLCYYQTGVGTYGPPGLMTSIGLWVAKNMDEAIAWYLDAHVMDGYKFLMKSYTPGDKISIFGFSRGAYTARALAGFLTKVGLLPRDNDEQVSFAYKMYKRTDSEGLILAAGFKETFCRAVEIEFLGVWDTVASTGILMSRNLPFTTNNSMIKTFRHALSLDERRAKFVPTFWQLSSAQPIKPTPGLGTSPAPIVSSTTKPTNEMKTQNSPGGRSDVDTKCNNGQKTRPLNSAKSDPSKKSGAFSKLYFSKPQREMRDSLDPQESDLDTTDVKQVWFAGCHSDVGGGAVKNTPEDVLSDIPLRWMVREVVASQCGIQFDAAVMASLNIHVMLPTKDFFAPPSSSSGAAQLDSHPSEKDCAADMIAATKPLHDELRRKVRWWILEVIPLPFSWQDANGLWHKKWRLHLGKGRYVNHTGSLLFHETVRVRMNDPALHYSPAAIYEKGKEKYVW